MLTYERYCIDQSQKGSSGRNSPSYTGMLDIFHLSHCHKHHSTLRQSLDPSKDPSTTATKRKRNQMRPHNHLHHHLDPHRVNRTRTPNRTISPAHTITATSLVSPILSTDHLAIHRTRLPTANPFYRPLLRLPRRRLLPQKVLLPEDITF